MLNLKLDILPAAQRALWNELAQTPRSFVLYGGTAMALRLGHRQSLDFDFFSNDILEPGDLLGSVPYLSDARIDQRSHNTLTVTVDRNGPVQMSFFGDVRMQSIEEPGLVSGNGVQIASLLDLTATKLKTIQQRAEAKDYVDIAAAMDGGITLSQALGAAVAIYGNRFNPIATLKALSYFADGNLPSLPEIIQRHLSSSIQQIDLRSLASVPARPGITRQGMTS